MSASLQARTVSGIVWTGAANVGRQTIGFVITILLARLLAPGEFGLVGMVVVFTGLARVLGEQGLAAAIVQRASLSEPQISSVFWISVLGGLVLTAFFWALAEPLARFYGVAQISELTRALAFGLFFAFLGAVPRAMLQRDLRFERLALIDVIGELSAGAVAIVLALRGAGAWSLVAHTLVASGLVTILALSVGAWAPKPAFSYQSIYPMLGYGAGVSGFNIVNHAARNVDDLLIGRVFGASPLGIYGRAYALMLLPISQVTSVVGAVMFPALSRMQGDRDRVRSAYLRVTAMIAFIAFPTMIGLLVVAAPLVSALYGPAWVAAVPVLQILCIAGIAQSICNPVGWIYLSQGRTTLLFWWGVLGSGAIVLAIIIGVAFGGIESVAWAYSAANVLLIGPCLAMAGQLIGMRVRDVITGVSGIFACAAAMGAGVALLALALPSDWPDWLRLLIQITAGVTVYATLVVALRLAPVKEIGQMLSARRRSRESDVGERG